MIDLTPDELAAYEAAVPQMWTDPLAVFRAGLAFGCARAEHEAKRLRILLAISYCGAALYTDDGELQDNRMLPFIDFKRDSISEIESKMSERIFRAATESESKMSERLRAVDDAIRGQP